VHIFCTPHPHNAPHIPIFAFAAVHTLPYNFGGESFWISLVSALLNADVVAPSVVRFLAILSYSTLVAACFNSKLPSTRPLEIHQPQSITDVLAAISRANFLSCPLGVRSDGHLFPASSLVSNGILIDAKYLNPNVDYDSTAQKISFGPGILVHQLAAAVVLYRYLYVLERARISYENGEMDKEDLWEGAEGGMWDRRGGL
jgi:hypothetical protein